MNEVTHIEGLGAFVRVSYHWFGPLAERRMRRHGGLARKLLRARDPRVPVAYLSRIYAATSLAVAFGLVPFALYMALGSLQVRFVLATLALPLILGAMTYSALLLAPDLRIAAHRRDLEANLPYALNFMAAMASAGVVPEQIFRVLGAQEVYGEVAQEANLIYRDTVLFNRDLLTALHDGAKRAPSPQWQELLEGAVSTITSGGELKMFMLGKAEQFTRDNRRKLKAFLENLGVMAESYVVVAAAAPLFMVVILSVMMLLSSSSDPILFLNLLVLVAMPLLHGSFAYILRTLRAD